jgi:hypothetical protein
MNSDLQRAQLELLNAHGSTHRLRLQYSADDLARFGHREVLRESAAAAGALNDFYSALEKKIPEVRQSPDRLAAESTGEAMAEAVQRVAAYLRQQREHYGTAARPIGQDHKARMWPYFSPELLEQVRMVELEGERVPSPAFYAEARAQGFDNLPELTHMDSLTFVDVVVFNEKPGERSLFHALVHAVQFQILGVERYTELFVQGFLRTKAHFTVPLEGHAFSLTSQFMRPSPEKFSVEDQVLRWIIDDRY